MRRRVPARGPRPRRSSGQGRAHAPAGLADDDLDAGAAPGPVLDEQRATQPIDPLSHDLQAVGVTSARGEPAAVVLDPHQRRGRVDHAGHPQPAGLGVLARVGDGLLRDPHQLGLGLDPQAGGALVDEQVDGEARDGPHPARVLAERRAEPAALEQVGAQVEDRQAQLGDDAGELGRATRRGRAAGPGSRRSVAGRRRRSPSEAISWAMPSWISRARRRRSSVVAMVRTSLNSSAVSSRSAASSTRRCASLQGLGGERRLVALDAHHADGAIAEDEGEGGASSRSTGR